VVCDWVGLGWVGLGGLAGKSEKGEKGGKGGKKKGGKKKGGKKKGGGVKMDQRRGKFDGLPASGLTARCCGMEMRIRRVCLPLDFSVQVGTRHNSRMRRWVGG